LLQAAIACAIALHIILLMHPSRSPAGVGSTPHAPSGQLPDPICSRSPAAADVGRELRIGQLQRRVLFELRARHGVPAMLM
jgi:hypothetical protein